MQLWGNPTTDEWRTEYWDFEATGKAFTAGAAKKLFPVHLSAIEKRTIFDQKQKKTVIANLFPIADRVGEFKMDIKPVEVGDFLSNQRARGWRPDLLVSYLDGSDVRFMATVIENKRSQDWELDIGLSTNELQSKVPVQKRKGFRPKSIASYGELDNAKHSVIWLRYRPRETDEPLDALNPNGASDCYRIAERLVESGKKPDAVEFYLRHQEYLRKLADGRPDDATHLAELSTSYRKLETLFAELKRFDEQLEQLKLGSETLAKIATFDPDNVAKQQFSQASHQHIGHLLVQLGRIQESVPYYEKSLELAMSNASRFPDDVQCQIYLAYTTHDIGDTRFRQARLKEASAEYQRALDIAMKQAGKKPTDASLAGSLALIQTKLGNVEKQKFRFLSAATFYQAAVTSLEAFSERTNRTPFKSRIADLKKLIVDCDTAEKSILDLDFALGLEKSIVSQQLTLRVQALLAYCASDPEEIPAAVRAKWSSTHFRNELFREAISTADKHRTLEPSTGLTLYDAACSFSLCLKSLNQHELPDKDLLKTELQTKSLEALRAAVAAGWAKAEHTATDTDLEPLRDLPEFKAILEELRAKPQ